MAPPDPVATATTSQSKRRRLLLHDAGKAAPPSLPQDQQQGNNNGSSNAAAAGVGLGLGLGLAEGFEAADLRLLEATPEILAALTQGGDGGLRVVGCEENAAAALVTRDATFELCRVETSNMLLLVPPLLPGAAAAEAMGRAAFHYEVCCEANVDVGGVEAEQEGGR